MSSVADSNATSSPNNGRFFMVSAIVMALVTVSDFLAQLAAGRSSFSSPPLVHAHAVIFMGWLVIYVLQNFFATSGRADLHRKLGWIAVGWLVAMIALGLLVTVAMVQRGQTPSVYRPLHFLIFDPAMMFTVVGLTLTAISLRHKTEWHRRLQFSAMAILTVPGIGRLLPSPLFIPWAWEMSMMVGLLFPILGALFDLRRDGRVHPAWAVGIGVIGAMILVVNAITYGPVGDAIYRTVTAGTPGAAVAPLAFPSPRPH
jgi:uncharacterized membrane protein YobD (UPF0266 family)